MEDGSSRRKGHVNISGMIVPGKGKNYLNVCNYASCSEKGLMHMVLA